MSATITIELCAEDRARLDHINVNLTELILRVMGSQKIDMGEVVRRAAPELAGKPAEQHPVTEPFEELPKAEPVPFEQPKPETPQYKPEDIQQKGVALSAARRPRSARSSRATPRR